MRFCLGRQKVYSHSTFIVWKYISIFQTPCKIYNTYPIPQPESVCVLCSLYQKIISICIFETNMAMRRTIMSHAHVTRPYSKRDKISVFVRLTSFYLYFMLLTMSKIETIILAKHHWKNVLPKLSGIWTCRNRYRPETTRS